MDSLAAIVILVVDALEFANQSRVHVFLIICSLLGLVVECRPVLHRYRASRYSWRRHDHVSRSQRHLTRCFLRCGRGVLRIIVRVARRLVVAIVAVLFGTREHFTAVGSLLFHP